jgi:crotonobetainyl-CoA:carnitine CoA-transferase CaiB-like acyl-CoA transferase
VEELNTKGIPSGEILNLDQALSSKQIAHRETIKAIETPDIGELKLFNLTAKFEKTPGTIDSPPPKLSEHTCDILKELGYNSEEIEVLKEQGII